MNRLLATKLFVSPLRPNVVPRSRLIERLNAGLTGKLTLISAPAGFGKTTLVGAWITEGVRPTAWLSLDEADNDPSRFLAYLVAALQTVVPDIGDGVVAALQAAQPPSEAVLVALLNEIADIPGELALVLDDYHVVTAQSVHDIVATLIEGLPPRLHLIITTREDPPLPLARLRARGQLTEFRAADLRFTSVEAGGFLNQTMGLDLSPDQVGALESRTEGWVAGLQLAAISLRDQPDRAGLIASFTGSHRFVADYLVEEVLNQQPVGVQAFLFRTSILSRLCGPLCDAILRDPAVSGQGTLDYLERANLFLIPLDNERHWYRYHSLFADVLRQRLRRSADSGELVEATYHLRASAWYEENGLELDALDHAIAANENARAARLAEQTWSTMDRSFQSAAWLGWVKRLPEDVIRERPLLSTHYAWALMDNGDLAGSESRLQDAERWLESNGSAIAPLAEPSDRPNMVATDQLHALPARIAFARAYLAQARGDIASTVRYAEQALNLAPPDDPMLPAQANVLLGLTYWANGDLAAAHRSMSDWTSRMRQAGNIAFVVVGAFGLVEILAAQGRLRAARSEALQWLQFASEHDQQIQRITAHFHLSLAMLSHEIGDRDAAARHLQASRDLAQFSPFVDMPARLAAAQARIKESDGDLTAALGLLDEAARRAVSNAVPDLRPALALKARVAVRLGDLTGANSWIDERGLSANDELHFQHECEHLTLARVRIAEYQRSRSGPSLKQALGILARLLDAAVQSERQGSVIEILVVQALASGATGDVQAALVPLKRALELAEPEGYVRIFADEGLPMARLLTEAATQGIRREYVGKLLAAIGKSGAIAPAASALASPTVTRPQPMAESLSRRELDVLRLIAEGRSNEEISERLYLALSTVKGHNRAIFDKLDVQRRTEAVARARELGLL